MAALRPRGAQRGGPRWRQSAQALEQLRDEGIVEMERSAYRASGIARYSSYQLPSPPPVPLVRHDRTAVSSAAGDRWRQHRLGARRGALLAGIEATSSAQAEDAISSERAAQIARHIKRAV